MSGNSLLRLPAAAALVAGAKRSKSRDRLSSLGYPISPAPLFPLSASNPYDATFPITALASDVSFPSKANNSIIIRSWGSRILPHPLQSGSEPLVAGGGDDGRLEDVGGLGDLVVRVGEALSMAFPLWVSSACLLALWKPPTFLWVSRTWQIVGLTLTMLGMGMTLTLDDLRVALLMPRELAAGFVLQYTVMPLSGYFVSKLLKLPSYYAAGLILVACCPGGTASNIVTYLARGNVALSVLMTATSTFTAAVMTPFLTSKLAGQFVAVDPAGLFISTVQVVLAPVLLGAILNQYCNNLVKFVSPLMPFIAVATVAILCGSAIAQNAPSILSSGFQVFLAVLALHALGFLFGYFFSKLSGIDESSARTISIEVGMQNSVLGVVLASQHFSNPLTAVPCAVSSICHSVYGSILAGIWRSMPVDAKVD